MVQLTRNIERLIEEGGEITVGRMPPLDCVATATDTRDEIPKNSGTNLPANLRRGKPFQPSHDPRRNVTKGGRPPDEFKALMRALVTEQAG